jgi:hypothetical protein
MYGMSDDTAQPAKPDGSAWKAHMDALSERNSNARTSGRKARLEHEREQLASHRASELRQMLALSQTDARKGKAQRP